jgi:diguanylate cyclase (GGDEF)-like protein/PAS domain S-box-containing protein
LTRRRPAAAASTESVIEIPALRQPRIWPGIHGRRPTFLDLPRLTGVAVAFVGWFVLLGWLVDAAGLKGIIGNAVPMQPNSAVSFVLIGSGLATIAWPADSQRRRVVARVLFLAAAAIALLTMIEYVGGYDLGIDRVLFGGSLISQVTTPGRMPPLTAICFALIACAAITASYHVGLRLILVLATIAALIAALNVVEYAFDADAPTILAGYTSMAIYSAITLCVLATGVIGLLGAASPMAALAGGSATARLFRPLLVISTIVPTMLAWARVEGQRLGLFDTGFGTSLMLVGTVGVIFIAILRSARWASDLEIERVALEAERDQFFDMSPDMLVVMGRDGRFRRVNHAWATTFGFAPSEVIGHPWTDFIHPDDLEETLAEAQQNLVEGEPAMGFTNRYRNKDGSYRWLEWASQQAPSGTVAFAVARDVTDRKRVDDRRIRQTRILEARNDDLNDRVAHDSLTGLHNRRFFETAVARLERSWARQAVDQRPPISVILFDLDHFGEVNKAHGHQAGDAVLRQFATILKKRFRESDVVARYGGEEFVAVLEGATAPDARRIAEGIRAAFEESSVDIGSGPPIKVTVSAGCAQLGDEANVSAGLSVADVWLAQAKRSGRNQVVGL